MPETPTQPDGSPLEITHDPTACRVVIEAMAKALNEGPKSRYRSLAITKLEEAAMWLNEALRRE